MNRTAIALACLVGLSSPVLAQTAPSFASVVPGEAYASQLKGLNVYNQDNKSVGEIEDIAFSTKGVDAYIVSVGGFLGMGTKYVAVAPGSITLLWDDGSKKWAAKMAATADQLKAAPEFKYPK